MKGFRRGRRPPHVNDFFLNSNEPSWVVDDLVLDRYLADECGPAEAARVERWLALHPRDAAAIAAVKVHASRPDDNASAENPAQIAAHVMVRGRSLMEAPHGNAARRLVTDLSRLWGGKGAGRRALHTWIDAATTRVVAMLLDMNASELRDDEVWELRERIRRARRGYP